MLDKMFFYDGNLNDVVGEKNEYTVIDARDGYTNNIKALEKVLRSELNKLVLTNQVVLLQKNWIWDKELHEHKVYLKDQSDGKWKHISRFTRVDLKYNSGIEKMFRSGAFNVDKAYLEKAERKKRRTLKFTIKEKE